MYIKRVDKDLPFPKYATEYSVGVDVSARETVRIPSRGLGMLPLNVVVKPPEGAFTVLLPRSSTFRKTGLILANSVGVIDPDYCGDGDEIKAVVYNTSDNPVVVNRGDVLFQLLFLNANKPDLIEVDGFSGVDRGGFGSTDAKK